MKGVPLVFAVNGERFELSHADPSTTVLEFLRTSTRFKGTKLGCGEGGCGACVVLLAKFDPMTKQVEEFSISSCLTPLFSIHLCAVTTTEGLGNTKIGFHSIHQRFAGFHASQCGFCTPGMCMSLYSALSNADKKKGHEAPPGFSKITSCEAEKAILGNLCRCTGYRPIMDACKSFSADVDMEDLGLNTFWSNGGNDASIKKLPSYTPNAMDTFPDFLKKEVELSLESICGFKIGQQGTSSTYDLNWYRPKSMVELQVIFKQRHVKGGGKLKLIVGNTSSGYYKELYQNTTYIDLKGISDLSVIRKDAAGIEIGAAVSISHVICTLREQGDGRGMSNGSIIYSKLADHMEQVASHFIRNMASLGGNLVIAQQCQFPSDIATILLAAGASVVIQVDSVVSVLSLQEYLEMSLHESEYLLLSVRIPNWSTETNINENSVHESVPGGVKLAFQT